MAPGLTAEDHVSFLVSCIRFSNNGKIDWEGVAKECNIVTKAAAAKRYERLLKANNIPVSGRTGGGGSTETTPAKAKSANKKAVKDEADSEAETKPKTPRKPATKKEPAAKKRKHNETPEDTLPRTPPRSYHRGGEDEDEHDDGLSQEVVKTDEVDYYGNLGILESAFAGGFA